MSIDQVKIDLRAQLSGASNDLIDNILFTTVEDFFRSTRIWDYDETISTSPGVFAYPLNPPAGATPWRVSGVTDGGVYLNSANKREAPQTLSARYYEFDRKTLEIHLSSALVDSGPKQYTAIMVLVPDSLSDVPEEYAEDFREILLDGTLYRMYMQPNRPYSNPGAGMHHGRKYKSGVNRIRHERLTSYAETDIGWSFPLATRSRNLR